MVPNGVLQAALVDWNRGNTRPLIQALGFQRIGLRIPAESLPDFGLDPGQPLRLEVAARHDRFQVLRIALDTLSDPEIVRRTAAALYRHNPARRALLIFESSEDPRLVFASWGLGPGPFQLLKLWIDAKAPRRAEIDILAGLAVNGAVSPSDLALAHVRALDREGLTRRFFHEFRRHRAELAAGLAGLPVGAEKDRLDLALILLSRLLFLYFIQGKGWLAADGAYLRHLYEEALAQGVPFLRRRLKPLFFGALNRPLHKRSFSAQTLGDLPYLNGGLFERDPLERKYPKLDVPDPCFAPLVYDLLEKYQFTLREDQPVDQDVAVDPEMLGKVFEGLMAAPERGATGTFFTPRPLVVQLTNEALSSYLARASGTSIRLVQALLDGDAPVLEKGEREMLAMKVREIRVLDPAVGSGAFLLATLHALERLRDFLDGSPPDGFALFRRRQEIISHNLHGVDLNGAAVRLCELRLWLALVVDLDVDCVTDVPPLPNLDMNIRQGDALVDPIDFVIHQGDLDHGGLAGRWQREVQRLASRKHNYFRSAGVNKRRAQRSLRRAERELAVKFLGELAAQIDTRKNDLRMAAKSLDLFGRRVGLTPRQRRQAAELRRRSKQVAHLLRTIRDAEQLPFFSFPIHFAHPDQPGENFDVIIGNPPWVRPHHWSGLARNRLKERFQFLRHAGWQTGSRLGGAGRGFGAQLDLSALFLERSLDLLSTNGTLGFLLPAKLARSLSGGGLRRRLLTDTQILRLEDWSLGSASLFGATTYPLGLLLARGNPDAQHALFVHVHDRHGGQLEFEVQQSRLPVLEDDAHAPWALVPSPVSAVLKRMRAAGPPLGERREHRPSRGVFTGANSVFTGQLARSPVRGGLVTMQLAGGCADVEVESIRPALRGEDLGAWRFAVSHAVIWTHDDDGTVLPKLPPAVELHLRKHRRVLRQRVDLKPGQPYWTVFRARPEKWARRVVWRDIAPTLEAAVVPERVSFIGASAPLISLNTVYQIAAAAGEDAHLLAAVLNSTVARAYLKAIAERASGGYFRFLGWTVGLLPFPDKPDAAVVEYCAGVSNRAHTAGALNDAEQSALDEHVARLYKLSHSDLGILLDFNKRLSNPRAER